MHGSAKGRTVHRHPQTFAIKCVYIESVFLMFHPYYIHNYGIYPYIFIIVYIYNYIYINHCIYIYHYVYPPFEYAVLMFCDSRGSYVIDPWQTHCEAQHHLPKHSAACLRRCLKPGMAKMAEDDFFFPPKFQVCLKTDGVIPVQPCIRSLLRWNDLELQWFDSRSLEGFD
jgi:hypothetical protein